MVPTPNRRSMTVYDYLNECPRKTEIYHNLGACARCGFIKPKIETNPLQSGGLYSEENDATARWTMSRKNVYTKPKAPGIEIRCLPEERTYEIVDTTERCSSLKTPKILSAVHIADYMGCKNKTEPIQPAPTKPTTPTKQRAIADTLT